MTRKEGRNEPPAHPRGPRSLQRLKQLLWFSLPSEALGGRRRVKNEGSISPPYASSEGSRHGPVAPSKSCYVLGCFFRRFIRHPACHTVHLSDNITLCHHCYGLVRYETVGVSQQDTRAA